MPYRKLPDPDDSGFWDEPEERPRRARRPPAERVGSRNGEPCEQQDQWCCMMFAALIVFVVLEAALLILVSWWGHVLHG